MKNISNRTSDDMLKSSALVPWGGGRFSRPTARNRYAIGDVHGCSSTLRALVEELLRLEQGDTLFLLGDYLDRGPDSKGVLDYLLQLRAKGYDIRPLLGNHEQMCLEAISDPVMRNLWYGNWGDQTVLQLGAAAPERIPRRYLDFMAALPRIITTEDYVFVHAGLDFRTENPVRDTAPEFMLWERDYHVQPGKIAGRTLICGHIMTPLREIRDSLHEPVICLDNGCFAKGHDGYGSLVALDLDTRQLLVQRNCEL